MYLVFTLILSRVYVKYYIYNSIGIYLKLTQGKATIFEVGGKSVNDKLFNYVNHKYNANVIMMCVCVCMYRYGYYSFKVFYLYIFTHVLK
jgi:hypothetical protein